MHHFAIARKRQFFEWASKLLKLSSSSGIREQDQQLNTKLRKKFVVYPVYSQVFLQRFKFLISFLKSLLKNKTKLKYQYRQKNSEVLRYWYHKSTDGTGTKQVPQ